MKKSQTFRERKLLTYTFPLLEENSKACSHPRTKESMPNVQRDDPSAISLKS